MGETSNFYEKCSSLSKKGDEKSLRTNKGNSIFCGSGFFI